MKELQLIRKEKRHRSKEKMSEWEIKAKIFDRYNIRDTEIRGKK